MSDLINRSIRPVVSVSTTFNDLRRVIRAIRFKYQHGMTLSYDVKQYITTTAPYLFQNYRNKFELINDYVKVLSDENNCTAIFCELALRGLVINCGQVTIDGNRLQQSMTVIDGYHTSSINFEKLMSVVKHLGRAITVTCSLIYAAAHTLNAIDIMGTSFFIIIRNLVSKPRYYEGNIKSYVRDLQYLLSGEITSKNPKLLKFLQVYGIDAASTQSLQTHYKDVASLYGRLTPRLHDGDSMSDM